MKLNGAVVLVTGASSGIGAAAAQLLAVHGARLLLTGRDEVKLHQVGGPQAARRVAHLERPGAAGELADWALSGGREVDVLVANAGGGMAGPLTDASAEEIERIVALNLTANIELTRWLLPGMLARRRGHLAFVSSIAGYMGVAQESVYSATKAGINGFAASIRHEAAGHGITVSVTAPGIVDTAFFARRGIGKPGGIPRPVSAHAAAKALVHAIENDHEEAFVPAWLRVPARLHGAVPGVIGRAQRRFRP